jgi:spoIIIJ-associated protein
MEWVETTGRTVQEALELALDQLGVLEDEVEFEILVEPKPGLFGRFGGAEARLRARVKPVSREKPGERRRGRKPRKSGSGSGSGSGDGASTRPARGGGAPAGSGDGVSRPDAGEEGPRPRRRRGGRSRNTGGGGVDNRPSATGRASNRSADEGETKMSDEPEISVDEQAEAAEEFTRGLVEAFGMDAVVSSAVDDEILLVEVNGENLGLLVGPRGATLQAIEELVRTVVQRRTGGHGMRIHVDVAGYRAKRREALAAFTRQLVEKVLDSGREQVLDPMPPPDRKVVHDTVGEFEGVETASEGEEPRRRVVIRSV